MGTANAWGGSGGKDWNKVRDQLGDFLDNPSDAKAEQLLPLLSDAIEWDLAPSQPEASQPVSHRLPASGPSGGTGSRGGGGGVVFGRTGGGSGGGRTPTKGRTRRSRAQAARVTGNVLAAGAALRRGDAEALKQYGLDLATLRNLSPVKQANHILNAVVGSSAAIEENELRAATGRALRRMLIEDLTVTDAIRIFVVEYVMQIYSGDWGETMRDGTRPGEDSAQAERQMRSVLRNRVAQMALPDNNVSESQLQEVVYSALGTMKAVMRQ